MALDFGFNVQPFESGSYNIILAIDIRERVGSGTLHDKVVSKVHFGRWIIFMHQDEWMMGHHD